MTIQYNGDTKGAMEMAQYMITAFENDGTIVLNETLDAKDDHEAKEKGLLRLREANHDGKGARIVRHGQMIYFERCKLPGKLKGTAS